MLTTTCVRMPVFDACACHHRLPAHFVVSLPRFLRHVEDGKADEMHVLLGGHAAAHLRQDQRPEKIDFNKTLGPYL